MNLQDFRIFAFCLWGTLLFAQQVQSETLPAHPVLPEAIPLNPEKTVLIDKDRSKILLQTRLCLRDGVLEMFICPKMTKEHESILSFPGHAQIIHAGLLAIGAEPGRPAKFDPEYVAPSGQRIDIYVNWLDEKKKPHRVKAQEWIRHATFRYFEAPLKTVPVGVTLGKTDKSLRYDDLNGKLVFFGTMNEKLKKSFLEMSPDSSYQKAVESLFDQGQPKQMEAEFLFAGSIFRKLANGTEVYAAEGGSLVCVANFSDAMIDVDIKSTASNDAGLLFEPWTERLPPVGTDVLVELIPVK